MLQPRQGPQPHGELETAHARQAQVEQSDVRLERFGESEGRRAVTRHAGDMASVFQDDRQHQGAVLLIIDHENAQRSPSHGRDLRGYWRS